MKSFKFFSCSAFKIPTFTVEVRDGEIVSVELHDTETAEAKTIKKQEEFTSEQVEEIGGYFKEMLRYNPFEFREMLSSLGNELSLYEQGSKILANKRAIINESIAATDDASRKNQLQRDLLKYQPCPLTTD